MVGLPLRYEGRKLLPDRLDEVRWERGHRHPPSSGSLENSPDDRASCVRFPFRVIASLSAQALRRTEHRVGYLCRPRRLCSAYGLARRFVLALLLLVEAVDATVWTAEASVGVRHLLHAGDLA